LSFDNLNPRVRWGFSPCACQIRRLVSLLSDGRRRDSGNDCLVHLESVSEVLCNLRRNHTCRQHFGERPVAVADLTVAETADKLCSTYPEGSSAVQNVPA
jgi:hypothetical protein